MTLAKKTTSLRTICEVLREIYDLTEGNKEITDLLQESYVMVKKMDAKLRQYHKGYDKKWWKTESTAVTQAKIKLRASR